jgi:hypothetical protein
LGNFSHMVACRSSLENIGKMSLIPVFDKKFTTGSYRVGIGHAWSSKFTESL